MPSFRRVEIQPAQFQYRPSQGVVSQMEEEMNSLISSAQQPVDIKRQLFENIRNKQRNLKLDELQRVINATVSEPDIPEPPRRTVESLEFIGNQRQRDKARRLLAFIHDKLPDIRFDDKQQIVIGGKAVHGSNYQDVINELTKLQQQKHQTDDPTGTVELLQALDTANAPAHLINVRKQQLMRTPPQRKRRNRALPPINWDEE